MGASDWDNFTPWQVDVDKALDTLRQEFAREKGISGARLLSDETEIGIHEQRPIIAALLQRQHAEVRHAHLTRTRGEHFALRTVAADQETNRFVAQERGRFE